VRSPQPAQGLKIRALEARQERALIIVQTSGRRSTNKVLISDSKKSCFKEITARFFFEIFLDELARKVQGDHEMNPSSIGLGE
jgi:hypothetical protein